jgi:hypothetical protein
MRKNEIAKEKEVFKKTIFWIFLCSIFMIALSLIYDISSDCKDCEDYTYKDIIRLDCENKETIYLIKNSDETIVNVINENYTGCYAEYVALRVEETKGEKIIS